MLYDEIYGAYYNTVAAVLELAVKRPVTGRDIIAAANRHAFGNSGSEIKQALLDGDWPLIRAGGTTAIRHAPSMPLTNLQKSWLKAIAADPRIRLFGEFEFDFPEVPPMFTPDDIVVFDRYSDGDNYADEEYIRVFRLVLSAIRERAYLRVTYRKPYRLPHTETVLPVRLEYSEKDDKFRVICADGKLGQTINIGRIINAERAGNAPSAPLSKQPAERLRSVIFELTNERNALERVLMGFSHFKRVAEKTGDGKYLITVWYDKDDETEMVIRILSYGPVLRVTAPQSFIELVKKRLVQQLRLDI